MKEEAMCPSGARHKDARETEGTDRTWDIQHGKRGMDHEKTEDRKNGSGSGAGVSYGRVSDRL